jgi:hypothetical protein
MRRASGIISDFADIGCAYLATMHMIHCRYRAVACLKQRGIFEKNREK